MRDPGRANNLRISASENSSLAVVAMRVCLGRLRHQPMSYWDIAGHANPRKGEKTVRRGPHHRKTATGMRRDGSAKAQNPPAESENPLHIDKPDARQCRAGFRTRRADKNGGCSGRRILRDRCRRVFGAGRDTYPGSSVSTGRRPDKSMAARHGLPSCRPRAGRAGSRRSVVRHGFETPGCACSGGQG